MKGMEEFIKRMEDEYYHQTRNGRDKVYIDTDDLNRLGYNIDKNKTGRVYVDAKYFKIVLDRFKFRDSLKVDIEPKQQTYKEFIREIKNKENERNREK